MAKPLPHELSGNKSSDSLIVFLHGYPDTTAVWDGIVPSFEKESYVLNVSYPNYSSKEVNPKGIDFDELLDRLKLTIDQVNDTNRKVLAVTHDWGSTYGFMFDHKYPGYFTQMIALDIGMEIKPTLFIVFYQCFLAIAFMIGGIIGKSMTHFIVRRVFKHTPPWLYRIDSSWNYSYYYIWKRILGSVLDKKKRPFFGYQLSCPIAFAWGTRKNVQFFGQSWADKLAKDPKNEVHAVDSVHWIMLDQPKFVIDLIRRRLRFLK